MNSESEEQLIILSAVSILTNGKKKRRKRRMWVKPYLKERSSKGRFFMDFDDMRQDSMAFKENFHMTLDQYDELLELLLPQLTPLKTTRPDLVSASEKLAITLEFLASGTLQRHMASCHRISKQRFGPIIESTCRSIFHTLSKLQPMVYTRKDWIRHANKFKAAWQFPNCLGAIDGKHCQIKCPPKGASLFYNYKGFQSIVLMAVADADSKFLYFDFGAYGGEGDSGVFSSSKFGKKLLAGTLDLPRSCPVYGKPMPFVFLADDAFPLHRNIFKPYKPTKTTPTLSPEEVVFNYRLSRARRCVENAFGVMCSRWQCLSRSMFLNPDRAQIVIAACCMLHNYLMRNKEVYCPPGFMDCHNENGDFMEGSFRKFLPEGSFFYATPVQTAVGRPAEDPIKKKGSF